MTKNVKDVNMAKNLNSPAKTKAWNAFARWKRITDCLTTTGYPFLGVCVTCDKQFHISFLDAGHCFASRTNAVLFHEKLVNIQCQICNQGLHGRSKKYRKIMEAKYGKAQVDKWEIEGKRVIHNRDMDFDGICKKYTKLTKEVLLSLGYNTYEEMTRGRDG